MVDVLISDTLFLPALFGEPYQPLSNPLFSFTFRLSYYGAMEQRPARLQE